jgi:hypothetical protein
MEKSSFLQVKNNVLQKREQLDKDIHGDDGPVKVSYTNLSVAGTVVVKLGQPS